MLLGWSLATWKVFSLFKIYLLCKIWPISVKLWKAVWICTWRGNDITVVSDLNEEQLKELLGERPDELLNCSLKNIVFLRVTWGLNQYSLQFITYKKNQMLLPSCWRRVLSFLMRGSNFLGNPWHVWVYKYGSSLIHCEGINFLSTHRPCPLHLFSLHSSWLCLTDSK